MSTNFRVGLQKVVDHSYDIEIGEGLFGALIEDLKHGIVENVSKFAIVTDSKVEALYGQALLEQLHQNDFQAELFSFPAGEKSKTRETKAQLEDRLLSRSYGQDCCILAIGGGAVTDLAGFWLEHLVGECQV